MTSRDVNSILLARAARARLLAEKYPASREAFEFCMKVIEAQESLFRPQRTSLPAGSALASQEATDLHRLAAAREPLLDLVVTYGPEPLKQQAQQLDGTACRAAIEDYLSESDTTSPRSFFARVLLQPAMVDRRLRVNRRGKNRPSALAPLPGNSARCRWCGHQPQVGCLRPQGDGLALSLICSLCLEEWPFPRGKCPACDEANGRKITHYSAGSGLGGLQVQVCESCRSYLHTVNLSEDPKAIPDIDEIAALPLDVWAREKGFEKLRPNLVGI